MKSTRTDDQIYSLNERHGTNHRRMCSNKIHEWGSDGEVVSLSVPWLFCLFERTKVDRVVFLPTLCRGKTDPVSFRSTDAHRSTTITFTLELWFVEESRATHTSRYQLRLIAEWKQICFAMIVFGISDEMFVERDNRTPCIVQRNARRVTLFLFCYELAGVWGWGHFVFLPITHSNNIWLCFSNRHATFGTKNQNHQIDAHSNFVRSGDFKNKDELDLVVSSDASDQSFPFTDPCTELINK